MEDNDKVKLAERFINYTNKHVFLTGKAGTGKTTFLKYITEHTHKPYLVTAPTGIAALNAGGVTLHSQFQLPFGGFIPERRSFFSNEQIKFETQSSILRHMRMSDVKRRSIQTAELLIIDEVSMLRADLLDAIDYVLKHIRKNNQSFGGLQLLFIGDLLQLPPVVRDEEWEVLREFYRSPFFFDGLALQNNQPVYIELDKIYRQEDTRFTEILNNIRYNRVNDEDIKVLNLYHKPGYSPETGSGFVTLTTHNRIADNINLKELGQLNGSACRYTAEVEDEFPENMYPCEKELVLKKGSQVMFIKNDVSGRNEYYNGKLAIVSALTDDSIEVKTEEGELIALSRQEWKNIRYKVDEKTNEIMEEILGTFKQYPLRLAWAITIHKSQGLTFEKAIVDVRNVFASGQAYVAMSRLRSLEGLVLSGPFSKEGIKNNESVIQYEEYKKSRENTDELFQQGTDEYIRNYCLKVFDFKELLQEWTAHVQSYNKEELHSEKQKHLEWAQGQRELIQQLSEAAAKFTTQLYGILEQRDMLRLEQRVNDAWFYFKEHLKTISIHIFDHRKEVQLKKRVKSYLLELADLESAVFARMQSIYKAKSMCTAYRNHYSFSGESFSNENQFQWRSERMTDNAWERPGKPASSPKRGKPVRKDAGETYQITYGLYENGMSIEEIAKQRSMAVGTIETHFAKLIGNKQINIKKLMSEDAIEKISECIDANNGKKISALKGLLGEDTSYAEIRMVLAHLKAIDD